MEFYEKIQELRKQKRLTQEELAEQLYVSRTAISKWESGRGYPSIESLKAIARYFSITVDELLSSDEILTIAAEDQKQQRTHVCDLVFGLLDLCMSLLLFLPLLAAKNGEDIRAVSLPALGEAPLYLKISYFAVVIGIILIGIFTLALQSYTLTVWTKIKAPLSLMLSTVALLLFIVSLQPYAAVLAFALLMIKTCVWIKWH